jgi:DNA-binding MarR family transcriptional regulator
MLNENFYTVQGWMVNELKLKGNELTLYAIIYGFTQRGSDNIFIGSINYLCSFISSSRQTVITNINSLIKRGLIVKTQIMYEGKITNSYTSQKIRLVKDLDPTSQEIGQKSESTSQEIRPNTYPPSNNDTNNDASLSDLKNKWNNECHLKSIVAITPKRSPLLNARLKEHGIESFNTLIAIINRTPFLKGDNPRGWVASFDWVIKPDNYAKILEDKYVSIVKKSKAQQKDDEYEAMKASYLSKDQPDDNMIEINSTDYDITDEPKGYDYD